MPPTDGVPPESPDPIPTFDLRRDGEAALDWAAGYLERVRDLPVMAQVEPGYLAQLIPPTMPDTPEPFSDVLADMDRVIVPGLTNWQHPRFFSYFATTASEPAILAEMLSATLNQVAFIWRSSPAATELETVMMSWVADLLGLPAEWHGHIEDAASTSTLAALVAGRHATGRTDVVFSEHAHSSVEKGARILGMPPVKVPSDSDFRMPTAAVEELLAAGTTAVVVATVGTTSSAAVDPVPELAELCERYGVWLHVDAAYAGNAWACPELRASQAGVERADSLVVNPHKWMLVPMDCSALFTRRPEVLREAFTLVPEYLRTEDEAANLSDYGPALGRRFRSLKLWTVMRCFGRVGMQEAIRRAVRLAHEFATWVEADDDWELVSESFSLVCLRYRGTDEQNLEIERVVNESGIIFITHTQLAGRMTLRFAVGQLNTTLEDVRVGWTALQEAAVGLRSQD